MASFTKNITNAVNVFGGGPSTKWGQANGFPYTMTWGTSVWGENNSLALAFIKIISNSQILDSDIAYQIYLKKTWEIGSMAFSHDMASQILRDGTGSWKYVFTSDTTAGESRSIASWGSVAKPDATFTCQAAVSTSWSEV